MQVLGYRFPGGFEDCIPVVSVEIAREGDFVHDEGVLHLLLLYLVVQSAGNDQLISMLVEGKILIDSLETLKYNTSHGHCQKIWIIPGQYSLLSTSLPYLTY